MQFIQAELWKRITKTLDEYGVIYEQCQTPRKTELEKLFEEMSDKFKATLTDKQQAAFSGLMSIVENVCQSSEEYGVALGLCFARELHSFLDNPAAAFQEASAAYTPVLKAERGSVKAIENYLAVIQTI